MRFLSRLKSVDFYKKLPSDLSEATLTGAWISILAAVMIASLLGLELFDFMSTKTHTEMVVDRSRQGELLRINFNISFPALSCEFATLDVSDALGTKRLNLTKTVRKTPIDPNMIVTGRGGEDRQMPEPKYDDDVSQFQNVDITQPLRAANFDMTVRHYPIVIVNFYAPWCPWCQRLEPAWEAATKEIHDRYPESDRRIRLAKVDCTKEQALCRVHAVAGFPSIRIYRSGHDDIYVQGFHEHEGYVGDRTKEALVGFAESLVPSAGNPHAYHPDTQKNGQEHRVQHGWVRPCEKGPWNPALLGKIQRALFRPHLDEHDPCHPPLLLWNEAVPVPVQIPEENAPLGAVKGLGR